jgi:putative ABC transport system permease protein
VTTGEPDNVVVIRKGAETEIQSAIDRQQANALEMHPAVALDPDGRPMVSKEAVVLISLVKASTGKPSNVVIRGVSPAGLMLRPRVKLVAGRMFAPGSSEIVVGSAIANGFSARSSATACISRSATGPSSASSTRAAAASIPRSGATWTS